MSAVSNISCGKTSYRLVNRGQDQKAQHPVQPHSSESDRKIWWPIHNVITRSKAAQAECDARE